MTEITNWTELLEQLSKHTEPIFLKLSNKINQTIRPYQKSNESFDHNVVLKNHQDIFNNFKLLYEQLLIETDAKEILTDIPALDNSCSVIFNITNVGKWIKFHFGNSNRIFFFDEEKTMISDKALADFLNKVDAVRPKYLFFGHAPTIYYKFKTLPSEDVINYLKSYDVIAIEFNEPTPPIDYPKYSGDKVLLDQSMVLTLCSNLSHGLSLSFYSETEDKTMEIMVENKLRLDIFLENKTIIINQYVYDQTKYKINLLGGPTEKDRFEKLSQKMTIVPDTQNPRFYFLKDLEIVSVSVAEQENAIFVTGNQRLCNKLDKYYAEIKYEHFIGAQLAESKYE